MKILIVDDEPLARKELRYLVQQNSAATEIMEAEGVADAEKIVSEKQPDMIFLDIHLSDGSGMALAERLKSMPHSPYIIFATAYDQYALEAFDADAVDYVLKPFRQSRINEAIARVKKRLANRHPAANSGTMKNSSRLLISNDERTIILQKKQILYVQAQQGQIIIQTMDNRKLTSKQTLTNVLQQLDSANFLRVHRSFIVNLNAVTELQPSFNHTYELTLTDGSKIPVSRSYVAQVKQTLGL